MPQYVKKPVVVDALEFDGTPESAQAVIDAFEMEAGCYLPNSTEDGLGVLLISTLEGVMTGSAGDFIIRGVKGECYPCKPDVFAKSYDPAPEQP